MKTITEQKNIYTFEELSENAQERAVQGEYETYPEELLTDELSYTAEELLDNTLPHAKLDNIYYDLSYSQGSGAVIGFHYNSLREFLDDFSSIKNYIYSMGSIDVSKIDFDEDFDFSFKCASNDRYCFEELDYDIDTYNSEYDYICEKIYDLLDDKEGNVQTVIHELTKEFTTKCYRYYENLFTDKDYWEDLWFYENGSFAGRTEDFEN